MFSYVDKNIRNTLEHNSKLVYLSKDGEPVPFNYNGQPVISLLGPIPMPRSVDGEELPFLWYAFVRRVELNQVLESASAVQGDDKDAFRVLLQERMSVNSIVTTPNFTGIESPLVRIHSCCMTGDVFGSMRCECGPQLDLAFKKITESGGAVVYMSSHEGRGIGLWAKAITYLLQDDGQDTYQANVSLGLPEDSRDFSDAAIVLRYLLKGEPIRLMSNNPLKKNQLEKAGQKVEDALSHVAGINRYNERYVKSKRKKGHNIPDF